MPGPEDRFKEEEEYQGAGFGDYAAGIGGGAMSGATAGSALGPWGAAIGGVLGGAVGGINTAFVDSQQEEAFLQQQALQRELDAAGADIESFVQDSAIAAGLRGEMAADNAAFTSRRAGLNPFQQAKLSEAIRTEAQLGQLMSQGQRVQAAQAAMAAERNNILQQYLTAQELQNSATPGGGLEEAFAKATEAAAIYGQLQGQPAGEPVGAAVAPDSAAGLSTAFAPDNSAARSALVNEAAAEVASRSPIAAGEVPVAGAVGPPEPVQQGGAELTPNRFSGGAGGVPQRPSGGGRTDAELIASVNEPVTRVEGTDAPSRITPGGTGPIPRIGSDQEAASFVAEADRIYEAVAGLSARDQIDALEAEGVPREQAFKLAQLMDRADNGDQAAVEELLSIIEASGAGTTTGTSSVVRGEPEVINE